MSAAVILIPGFFGFGRFGTPPHTLEYFHGVRDALEAARPDLAGRILVHEPPPTGSLDERAASLHEAVKRVLAGEALRNNPPIRADRIHLIGHSTGGVDARLYANHAFRWLGGPEGKERREPLEKLGHVVSLSAPHAGTPIADHAVLARDAFLLVVYFATLWQRGHKGRAGSDRMRWGIRSLVPKGTLSRILELASGLDEEGAAQLREFWVDLLNDRQLMPDLTPRSMRLRTKTLAPADHPQLRCYVSVSPPPRLMPDEHVLWRLLYSRAYAFTSRDETDEPFPSGRVLGGAVEARRRDRSPCDGVVPAASQTTNGTATGIIEGDHLDVVGHYSGEGGTVFKCDAAFDDDRFRTLWNDIAAQLD